MNRTLNAGFLPPGMALFYWLRLRGLVRSLFHNLESSLFTLATLAYFILCASFDFLHLGMLLQYREFGGYVAFSLLLLLLAPSFGNVIVALFSEEELQWIVSSPWNRAQQTRFIFAKDIKSCLVFALGTTFLCHSHHFWLTFSKAASLLLLFRFVPWAIRDVLLRRLKFSPPDWLGQAFAVLFLLSIYIPIHALYDLNVGSHSGLAVMVVGFISKGAWLLPFQLAAESFLSSELFGSLPWLMGSATLISLSLFVLQATIQPWGEEQLAPMNRLKLRVHRIRGGLGSRVIPIHLPSLPRWGGLGTLLWLEAQIFARAIHFPLLYLFFGFALDTSMVLMHITFFQGDKASAEMLTPELYWFQSAFCVALSGMAVLSTFRLRFENIKALPIEDWKAVLSFLLPSLIFQFFAIQLAYLFRLILLSHFHFLQEPIGPLLAISLLRALPFSAICVSWVMVAICLNIWIGAKSRCHHSWKAQLLLFVCRIGGISGLALAGIVLIVLAGPAREHSLQTQLVVFSGLCLCAFLSFLMALGMYRQLDAASVLKPE